jgi:hypothetical protein
MISVENKRPLLIEHLARKAAPDRHELRLGQLDRVRYLRARSLPTFSLT